MPLEPWSIRLDGRLALVTGAAAGIGRACAGALARFGADVAVCDRDASGLDACVAEIAAAGRAAHPAVLDVRDAAEVEGWIASVGASCHRIDVVVNNAGGGFEAPFLGVSSGGQRALVDENFTSVTTVTRAAVAHMSEGGAIVNVTSIEAHRAAPGYAVYAAMKAAVANLTRSLALELGGRGIRVNAVAPDVISTPGVPLDDGPLTTPLPRRGRPDDVAAAVLFLASEMAAFVTGTTLHVDGGNHAAGGWRRTDIGDFTLR